ncbi:MAG: hypothetical protein C0612_01040 [Desulfobulbaceae bacterium]|nr:MAG: hypothetical protein C0612_01040 [Desulfobulbaceae bacterium]
MQAALTPAADDILLSLSCVHAADYLPPLYCKASWSLYPRAGRCSVACYCFTPKIGFEVPFCAAEHRSCRRNKTLDLFESTAGGRVFSVPATARSAREPEGPVQRGALFLLLLLGKQKKEVYKEVYINKDTF